MRRGAPARITGLVLAAIVLVAPCPSWTGRARGVAQEPVWERMETPAGTVFCMPRDRPTGEQIAALLPSTRDRIARDLGLLRRPAVEIWIAAPGQEPGWVAHGAPLVDWAAGFAFSAPPRILLRPARALRGSLLDLPELLAHEIAHLMADHMAGPARGRIPRWFHEGLAMQAAGELPSRTLPRLLLAAGFRRLLPLSSLEDHWPAGRGQAELAYAQAHHFVGFVEAEAGPGCLGAILRRLRGGSDFPEAFRQVTGRTPLQAEARWSGDLRKRSIWIPLATGGVGLWVLMALLVLAGWTRKKIQAREIMERWDEEDGW